MTSGRDSTTEFGKWLEEWRGQLPGSKLPEHPPQSQAAAKKQRLQTAWFGMRAPAFSKIGAPVNQVPHIQVESFLERVARLSARLFADRFHLSKRKP
jgi:hypothetical protein